MHTILTFAREILERCITQKTICSSYRIISGTSAGATKAPNVAS